MEKTHYVLIDWEKPGAFDKEDILLCYELFAKGELTEDWLKANTKIAWDFSNDAAEVAEDK